MNLNILKSQKLIAFDIRKNQKVYFIFLCFSYYLIDCFHVESGIIQAVVFRALGTSTIGIPVCILVGNVVAPFIFSIIKIANPNISLPSSIWLKANVGLVFGILFRIIF